MEVSEQYWEGARQGRLVLQRCTRCGTVRHYPRLMCAACQSMGTEPLLATGRGTVHSWTISHHPFAPEFADQVPYTLLTVDLDEGVRALGRLIGNPPLRIGLPVAIEFRPGEDGRPLPWFASMEGADE